jgi:hypothetical protein
MDEAINSTNLSVFPNPADRVFYVKGAKSLKEPLMISIYNALGQKVHEEQIIDLNTAVDIEKLPTGLYTLTITSSNYDTTVGRLVIQR